MKIKIPASDRKKALFVVDVQTNTLKNGAENTIGAIRKIVRSTAYDLYVVFTYHAGPDSMFFKQGRWQLLQDKAGKTDAEILNEIGSRNAKVLHFTKQTRSGFKNEQGSVLLDALKAENIKEIHVVGYDINDCVLATAYDAVDLGFFTYVIEEGCNHYENNQNLVDAATKILRRQKMTNNSNLFDSVEIDL